MPIEEIVEDLELSMEQGIQGEVETQERMNLTIASTQFKRLHIQE